MDCLAAYKELSSKVFGQQKSGRFHYDVEILEEQIRNVLHQVGESEEALLYDSRDDCCRTFVVAKRHLAIESAPVLFKSYEVDGTEIQCTIIQAARATSAAPTYFPPIEIEYDQYVDGGIGFNNPAEEALREALRIWPGREIGCLVSVGTGLMEPISGENATKAQFGAILGPIIKAGAPLTAEKLTVAAYCTELATSCQQVHMSLVENPLLRKKTQRPRYYRFNVMSGMSHIGLDEANKLKAVSQMTDAYLHDPERRDIITDCVELLSSDAEIKAVLG